MKLWLQRHAAVLCESGLCYGQLDVPADPVGTREAAQRLAAALPADVQVRSSPRSRCTDLAQALAELRPDLQPVVLDERLAEMGFGRWEGQPWGWIARADFEAWTTNFWTGQPGGDGESTQQFMARVGKAWDDWQVGAQPTVWICHAGVMRAVHLLAQGYRQALSAAQWPSLPLDYGALRCWPDDFLPVPVGGEAAPTT